MKRTITTAVISGLLVLVFFSASGNDNRYAVVTLNGIVNPVVAEYLTESIARAGKDGAGFIVMLMDTPGGLMDSMRDIIKAVLSSKVPVVVYTFPSGARAASAGGFIMLASHVAVMAPGTEIGAMHPVSPMLDFLKRDRDGQPSGVMEKKVLNDTVAYARSLAQKRGRSVQWAERAVKSAVSSTYREALSAGVIDFIADDMDDLLRKLHGRRIVLDNGPVVLSTKNVSRVDYSMDWKQKLINAFADPQIMQILFIIAIVGIGMEFKNPGMIVPGVIGALSLFMFLMAMKIIPINILGLALIVLSVVLFILELNFVSYGLLTLGGLVSFVLGSMILFDSPLPGGGVPMSSIIATLVFVLAFVFIVIRAAVKVHRTKVTTGSEGLIGETGSPVRAFMGRGRIKIHGEIWNARSDEELHENDNVVVTGVDGMDLKVKRK